MVTLVKCQASYEELDDEDEEEEKELLLKEALEEGPYEGKMLVIRLALSGLASQNDFE